MDKQDIAPYLKPPKDHRQISSLSCDFILSLLYFDIFKYPLTIHDLEQHCKVKASENTIQKELDLLVADQIIQSKEGYFFLGKEEHLVQRRIDGNKKATEYILKAQNIAKFISLFPFVKGIFISGSVSKGYADKDSDIDYFIITSPNRLWLTRTLLILFKKTFLLNSKKYFCLNYFIDEDHLEIPDKNIFTAVELNYLLPLYNENIYNNLKASNKWMGDYFPNFTPSQREILPEKKVFIKRISEKILDGYVGNKLDDFFLKITEKFWQRKFRYKYGEYAASIRCKKYVSKIHPGNYQERVLDKYESKISEFEKLYKVTLR